jgi:hypothetical protein
MHACINAIFQLSYRCSVLRSIALCLGSIGAVTRSLGFALLRYDKRISDTAHAFRCVCMSPRHMTGMTPLRHVSLANAA